MNVPTRGLGALVIAVVVVAVAVVAAAGKELGWW